MGDFTSLLNFQLTASPVGFAGAVVSEELPGGAIYPSETITSSMYT